MALNTALSHDRRQAVREEVTLSDDNPLRAGSVPSLEATIEEQDRLDRLYAAMGRLEEFDKALIDPRYSRPTSRAHARESPR